MKPGPTIIPEGDLGWQCACFQDDTGTLHRWATIDKIEDSIPMAELHSWYVSGDMLAARVPMQLHLIEIGSQRHGHQHSPWCKAFKHPAVAGRFAFQKQDGRPLQGDWKPVWYQDSTANNAKDWVDMMQRDNVRLIRHLQLKQASEKLCAKSSTSARKPLRRATCLRPQDAAGTGIHKLQIAAESHLTQKLPARRNCGARQAGSRAAGGRLPRGLPGVADLPSGVRQAVCVPVAVEVLRSGVKETGHGR